MTRVQRPRGRKPSVFIPALLLQNHEAQVKLHQLHRSGQVMLTFYWSIIIYCLSLVNALNTCLSLVREILGTAQSVGCTIDGETPQEWLEKIADGDFECPEE